MNSVLILDDDINQLNYLKNLLSTDFKVAIEKNAISAMKWLEANSPEAIIVDVHMPIINGFEFIENYRIKNPNSTSSIFILSSDTKIETKIKGLSLGVKDFLWPDMDTEEIKIRIKNHISQNETHHANLIYKNLFIDKNSFSTYLDNKRLELTLIEFKILSELISRQGQIIPREEIKNFTWPGIVVLDKTLNTHLTNLRNKLKNAEFEIKSIKGEGIIVI